MAWRASVVQKHLNVRMRLVIPYLETTLTATAAFMAAMVILVALFLRSSSTRVLVAREKAMQQRLTTRLATNVF